MKVTVNILMKDAPTPGISSNDRLYERSFDWDAVPRVGDQFELDPEGGWSHEVYRVWWSERGVQVELGSCVDSMDEGLEQILIDNGWRQL